MKKQFVGGVHPSDMKALTEHLPVEVMPAPSQVSIPLVQHMGKAARPIVAVGDAVKCGQIIAEREDVIGSNVFSSVSGVVKEIDKKVTPTGSALHIVIENDRRDDRVGFEPLKNPTARQVIDRIKEAGIVGMGGAGFPTDVKLTPKTAVDTLIINAAECEPYITCDNRIMLDYTNEFLRGVRYLATALGLKKAYIGIEDNKSEAIELVSDAALFSEEETGIEVVVCPLKTHYPQGAEKQMIYAVSGRKVPVGAIPSAIGVVVCNVHTALSTYYAVAEGEPLYRRIMTVTGEGIANPKNIWVRTGTLYGDVIEFCGGLKPDRRVVKMINGGPMMGTAVSGSTVSCTKTTGCLLLLTDSEASTISPSACINCGKCAKVCPMRLMPMYIDLYARGGDIDTAVKYGLSACIECGCCAFVCPAKRTLVQSFRLAKKQLKGRKK